MARLQILELPTEHHGDDMTTPWVLIVDQASKPEDWLAFQGNPERLGARAILIFEETVDIPANDTLPSGTQWELTVDGRPAVWAQVKD